MTFELESEPTEKSYRVHLIYTYAVEDSRIFDVKAMDRQDAIRKAEVVLQQENDGTLEIVEWEVTVSE